MDYKEDAARKYVESLPPDGHFEPGQPAWNAESIVRAFVAGAVQAAFDADHTEEIARRLREAMPGVPIKTGDGEIHIGEEFKGE